MVEIDHKGPFSDPYRMTRAKRLIIGKAQNSAGIGMTKTTRGKRVTANKLSDLSMILFTNDDILNHQHEVIDKLKAYLFSKLESLADKNASST